MFIELSWAVPRFACLSLLANELFTLSAYTGILSAFVSLNLGRSSAPFDGFCFRGVDSSPLKLWPLELTKVVFLSS
jgi:hypothetical protein